MFEFLFGKKKEVKPESEPTWCLFDETDSFILLYTNKSYVTIQDCEWLLSIGIKPLQLSRDNFLGKYKLYCEKTGIVNRETLLNAK